MAGQPENFAVNVTLDQDHVVIQFAELVKVMRLPPREALRFALMLITAANARV